MPRRPFSRWSFASLGVALLVLVPVAVVVSSAFVPGAEGVWDHLVATRMSAYAVNTTVLVVGVCTLTAVLGVPIAWLVAMHEFPGRRVLSWAMLLPLAVPAYLSAYALTDLFQASGPVQTWWRATTGLETGAYWFPDLRTRTGAIVIIGGALVPYVYIGARAAFQQLPPSMLDASRTLGRGPLRTFGTVAVPLAWPAIAAALLLVLMETVADYGAVEHCAVDTFATGIYRTWYGLDAPIVAAQLASTLLVVLALVMIVDGIARRGRRFSHTVTATGRPTRTPLRGLTAWGATGLCLLPVSLGFLLPTGRLAWLAATTSADGRWGVVGGHAWNSFVVAAIAAGLATVLAVVVLFAQRIDQRGLNGWIVAVCRCGYALPGPIIAIGLLTALGWVDHRLHDLSLRLQPEGRGLGLLLTGSVVAVVLGYQTRFLAVALAMIEGGYAQVHRHLDDAARTLGGRPWRLLLQVHVPALRASLLAAGLLVFVDVVKELPATLMLRPFDFETLAVRVYQMASDERLDEAAIGGLIIIAISLVPMLVLHRLVDRAHGESAPEVT